jgi:PqqD family protein of HPr-rel-A system
MPGLQVEPLGGGWVAFSPASGETLLLNDEAAAILEVLSGGAASMEAVYAALALDTKLRPADVAASIADSWEQFVRAGLVRRSEGSTSAS